MWSLQAHCPDHSRSGTSKPAKVCPTPLLSLVLCFYLSHADDDDDDDDDDTVNVSDKAFMEHVWIYLTSDASCGSGAVSKWVSV